MGDVMLDWRAERDADPTFTYAVTLKNAAGKKERRHFATFNEAIYGIGTIARQGEWRPTGIQGYCDGEWRHAIMDNVEADRIIANAMAFDEMSDLPGWGTF